MKNLKSAFKPVPERFHYSVQSAIDEAVLTEKKRRRFAHPVRAIIAAAIVVAMIPTSVFAATQIYSLITKQAGKYAVDIQTESSPKNSSPKYVKLQVDVPEGFKAVFDDIKYHKVPETADGYLSLWLIRPKNKDDFHRLTDVKSVKQTEINGKSAVIALDNENPVSNGSRTVDVFYEDVNIILEANIGADVSDKEMNEFLNNVEIIKGTKNNYTEYTEPENGSIDRNGAYSVSSGFKEIAIGEKVNLGDDYCTASMDSIKVLDNVKELDRKSFVLFDDYSKYVNENGSLKPRIRETWKWGDGVNTRDEKIKSKTVNQKFVLADITFTNNTDKDIDMVSTNVTLHYLTKNGKKLTAHQVESTDPHLYDGDYQYKKGYINKDAKDDFFYIDKLKAHESQTITVGYFCDEDLLDNAYLNIESDKSGQVVGKIADFDYCSVKVLQ